MTRISFKTDFLLVIVLILTMGCNDSNQKSPAETLDKTYDFPFQNMALDVDSRVSDLLSRMTLEEKVGQLFNKAPAIERLGIPRYNWWNEALHGVARSGRATVFPQAIGLAATFDEDLMHQVATAISDEGRAKYHNFANNDVRSIYTGLTYWSPNINIFRDPRWGRGQETYGEDPYLTSAMGVSFIKGLQGDDPDYLKSVATVKHYAVHSGPEETRHIDNLFVNDRDLYETYLPAFRSAVKEANVQSVMCAYNRFRDRPCCGSDLLLNKILRNDYGFEGYIVSDCGAISDFYIQDDKHHGLVDRPSKAWGWAVAAGTDLNCEESEAFLKDNLPEALEQGILNEADINTALIRLFTARFKLGLFDSEEQQPYSKIPIAVVGSEKHRSLSLKAAEASLVLLKNDGILPLDKASKIALIGPNAHNKDVLLGNYNGTPIDPITPLTALATRLGKENMSYAPGAPLVPGFYGNMLPVPSSVLFHEGEEGLEPGLKAEYFKDLEMKGRPDMERVDPSIDFIWDKTPISGKLEESFSVTWSGILRPETTGSYQFRLASLYGNATVYLDGKNTEDQFWALRKGNSYALRIEYTIKPFWWGNTVSPDAALTWVNRDQEYEAEALAAAQHADVIVFCGGISPRLEGEEMKLDIDGFAHGDRTHLRLPAIQETLLKKLKETGKPIVYVNFSGGAVALNWENENLDAIVQAFYPGESAGTALANLLYGDFSPTGKLPVTFYTSVDDLPDFLDYAMKNRTYRYFDGEPLYPFGHGLGYATFHYSDLTLPEEIKVGDEVTVLAKVTNQSEISAGQTVQLYLRDTKATAPVPKHTLAGIQNVFLKAGETKELRFTLQPRQFSLINGNYERTIEPGEFEVSVGEALPTIASRAQKKTVEVSFEMGGDVMTLPK